MMNFELLPNEILLDLFDYLDGTDLFDAFYGLNYRFNDLICNGIQFHRFNFRWVSKRNFGMICQQVLPSLTDRIISLNLSDLWDSPNNISLFFSYIPNLIQFTQLKFLSLAHMKSYQTITKAVNEFHHLSSLMHLRLHCQFLKDDQPNIQSIINNIWSLPKLICCHINIFAYNECVFSTPTILSSSLEYLSIDGCQLLLNQMNQLFEYTPRLTRLSLNIYFYNHNRHIPSIFQTLTKLKIRSYYKLDILKIISFLQNTRNLCHLKIDLHYIEIDGHQWEQIIRNNLPKLKIFRLNMTQMFDTNENLERKVDHLINSFRSLFWIEEHRWFVRCYNQDNIIYLSTSFASDAYRLCNQYYSFQSTYPFDDEKEFYNNRCYIAETFFDQPVPSHIRLYNIIYIEIKLPINDQFWNIVPNLVSLKSIRISSHVDTYQSQVQNLLDRTFSLMCLCIVQDESLPLQKSLFKYTISSLDELHLYNRNFCFNADDCMALVSSPLGRQCKRLFIRVNNRRSIIYLVTNMFQLRLLTVEYDKDTYSKQLLSNTNRNQITLDQDELLQWLSKHLPSTCSYRRLHPSLPYRIAIWI